MNKVKRRAANPRGRYEQMLCNRLVLLVPVPLCAMGILLGASYFSQCPLQRNAWRIVRKRPDWFSRCLLQRDSQEQCRRRRTAPDRPVQRNI